MWNRRSAGVTLIELIVAIVIVGVALAGLLAAFSRTDRASVDPVITQQMAIVAEGFMEEILLKQVNGAPARPALRSDYTHVAHYAGYTAKGVVDVEGNAVPGLELYGVSVAVAQPTAAQALPNVPAADTLRIQVTVTHANDPAGVTLVGWRTGPPALPAGGGTP
jgi:MSHA pilin protein MshD